MKYLILVASLALAGNALAEDKPKSIVKPVDKSTPVLMETAPPADTSGETDADTGDRGQDHNSSRSNKTASAAAPDGVVHRDIASRSAEASDFGMSRATEQSAPVANQNSSRSNRGGVAASPPAEGADYNSSRSNKTHAPVSGDGGSGGASGTKAQDYNSSRSNVTTLREDDAADLDGDGRPDLVACDDGVAQNADGSADAATTGAVASRKGYDYYCNKSDSAAAPAAPARPANHNTTRSNR